jgi:predicted lipid-binding transport protein (Tim44 family)
MQGARAAFTMIVEDFAKGDMTRIENLLGPNVRPHFQNAIEARRKAGQVMESRVARIREAEATTAHVEDTIANVTIRFVSEQENVLRDAGGRVIGGAPETVEEITDIWTFSRDTKSADPNWILIETRS